MWYVWDVLYAVLYVRVNCFVVRGCAVSRRYINVCHCDMFSVVDVYHDHLKFWVVCIDGRRYVCYSECNVTCVHTHTHIYIYIYIIMVVNIIKHITVIWLALRWYMILNICNY